MNCKGILHTTFLKQIICAVLCASLITVNAHAAPDTGFYERNNIQTYFEGDTAACVLGSSGSSPTSGGSSMPGDYTLDQVKAFARQTITSTWNITDSTIEQWYLKQDSAQIRVSQFGLNATNISEVTAAVKAANVSPVYFYTYAVTEGGGLGGFINHYGSSLPGGPANAKRDAEYIASQAQKTGDNPAWQDLGTSAGNGNFVPKNIQDAGNADFASMPVGTIGRIFIPATAAAAWEIYYPEGLKGSVNGVQNYGPPIQNVMKSIKRIGGNPLDGGVTVSSTSDGCTTNVVAGEGMTKAINWALMIANNDGYGYDQNTRETGYVKWQLDPNCGTACGSLDCSSFVSAALTVGGFFKTNPNFATSSLDDSLGEATVDGKKLFERVNISSFSTSNELQPGDILNDPGSHTEIYIGNNQTVGAHINEKGGINGGEVGDQTGKEISVGTYSNHPWKSAWRAVK